MKIYSWNIALHNKNPDNACAFLETLESDVIALQEVTPYMLEKLSSLSYHIAHSTDFLYRGQHEHLEPLSLVVLSRHPIQREIVVPFPDEWYSKPWRFLGRLLRETVGWDLPYRNKTGLITVINHPTWGSIQIVCSHLSLGIPSIRINEFNLLMQHIDEEKPIILCGDLNILETPQATLLNWLAGAPFEDFIMWWRERTAFESLFKKYLLKNPLRHKITHGFVLSQLDHILVPKDARVIKKRVIKKRYGSDHNPVMIEIELPKTKTE